MIPAKTLNKLLPNRCNDILQVQTVKVLKIVILLCKINNNKWKPTNRLKNVFTWFVNKFIKSIKLQNLLLTVEKLQNKYFFKKFN
jgi:hypothetical protein